MQLPPEPRRRARRSLVAVGVGSAILICAVGYAAAGFAYAQLRIAGADRALNAAVSHENTLNTSFHEIDTQFTGLRTGTGFNPTASRALIDRFIAGAQAAGRTVDQDDASLAAAGNGLEGPAWLTVPERGRLDREAARVAHARVALGDARVIAAGHVMDGRYFGAFMDALVELDAFNAQTASGDYTGASATLTKMKSKLDAALQLATAPGLPPEIHNLTADFETLTADYAKLLAATQSGDGSGAIALDQTIQTDASRISAYNFDAIFGKIDAYYKPLVDGFNTELAAATA